MVCTLNTAIAYLRDGRQRINQSVSIEVSLLVRIFHGHHIQELHRGYCQLLVTLVPVWKEISLKRYFDITGLIEFEIVLS